jgi:hypothetical protein
MTPQFGLKSILLSGVVALAVASPAHAESRQFRVPAGDLADALDAYAKQSSEQLIYSAEQVRNARTAGVQGNFERTVALDLLLQGTQLAVKRGPLGAVIVERAAFRSEALGTAGLGAAPPRELAGTSSITLAAAADQPSHRLLELGALVLPDPLGPAGLDLAGLQLRLRRHQSLEV